jgi:integrase
LLNDFTLNVRKLKKFIGEDVKTVKDEAYTREDIQRMFQEATFRTRMIISIYSSTGMRKGALLDLRLKHIHKTRIENLSLYLYKFVIYENTKDEYITFCTPECASMIDAYLDQRRTAGEKITEESYLIRNDFDRHVNGRNVRQSNVNNIARLFDRLLDRIEFREVNHITENYKYQRHKKSQFHAFRKYFNTCLANCDVNVTIKEMLMGHSVGLDDSYFRPNEKQLLSEYCKAINELTINEEFRLRTELDVMKEKQDKIQVLVDRITNLEKQLGT